MLWAWPMTCATLQSCPLRMLCARRSARLPALLVLGCAFGAALAHFDSIDAPLDAYHRQARVDREAKEQQPQNVTGWLFFMGLLAILQIRKWCSCAASGTAAMQPIDFVFRNRRPVNHFLDDTDVGQTVELASYGGDGGA